MRKHHTDISDDDHVPAVIRSEEELHVETTRHEIGKVHAHKVVDTEHVTKVVPRYIEHADVERVAPEADDSGQIETIPDGSVSIPVFEEQLVIEKRLVVIERVIIRKHRIGEEHKVEADLRRERVEINTDRGIADRSTGQAIAPRDQP